MILGAPAVMLGQESHPTLHSIAVNSAELPSRTTPGGVVHAILNGKSATTGYEIEAHATSLDPGKSPHSPHRHRHDEMFVVRAGTVEFTINGAVHRLGPGSVAIAANNDEHGVKNIGTEVAEYVVIALGQG